MKPIKCKEGAKLRLHIFCPSSQIEKVYFQWPLKIENVNIKQTQTTKKALRSIEHCFFFLKVEKKQCEQVPIRFF